MCLKCVTSCVAVKSTTTLNLALRKPTQMSSTMPPYVSSRVVDGNKNTNMLNQSCSRTNLYSSGNWWQVDLLAIFLIRDVVITTRGDDSSKLELNQSFYTLFVET